LGNKNKEVDKSYAYQALNAHAYGLSIISTLKSTCKRMKRRDILKWWDC
jgi:hypothetical protein